ncbi:MAG TPA: TetR/AcrR family transcriptional regulator [Steroidobacteraceae bacterium]|nr:TetR/AcrR family transcriptional regulator [Steroidobacteraceae bacterium]HQX46146.1 TetR/AcrR family transcriptional regulator [Steroidobacteraceae bacterium]HQX78489.1 TetR/AcrR family transcriptional regulator [Steroidobacteraceae bacterium]HQZ80887.1 TetR/AcrR family transcriptional regulator [Steroidobacteraceae bacterium]
MMEKAATECGSDGRAAAQRKRILCAAQKCFVERGFHAASMATIAETAAMSPGLIYRYFRSKNEIILAIIGQQLEVVRERISELHATADLAGAMAGSYNASGENNGERISAPLFLEMSAEATRDPQIAAATRASDTSVRDALVRALVRSREEGGYGVTKAVAAERALMLMCLIEGLKVREAREPDLDRKLLKSALAKVLAAIFEPPQRSAQG